MIRTHTHTHHTCTQLAKSFSIFECQQFSIVRRTSGQRRRRRRRRGGGKGEEEEEEEEEADKIWYEKAKLKMIG